MNVALENATAIALLAPAARTSTGNGTGFDTLTYDGRIVFVLNSAAGTGTSPTLDVKIQDSADNSTFADVAGLTFTQVTGAASIQKIASNKPALRRYVRAVTTIGGTTPSFTCSAEMLAVTKAV